MITKLFDSEALLLLSLIQYWSYCDQCKDQEGMKIARKEITKSYNRLKKLFPNTPYACKYDELLKYILEFGEKCGIWYRRQI